MALIFIGIPFVVRSVQPVLEKIDLQYEEAAHMLGANTRQTVFRVILPEIAPVLLAGFTMSFARGSANTEAWCSLRATRRMRRRSRR